MTIDFAGVGTEIQAWLPLVIGVTFFAKVMNKL